MSENLRCLERTQQNLSRARPSLDQRSVLV